MKKLLTSLWAVLAIIVGAPAQSSYCYFENFNNTSGTELPEGWQVVANTGSTWTTGTSWQGLAFGAIPAYEGRSLGTGFATSGGATSHDSWLLTPGVKLSAGLYTLKFMLWMNSQYASTNLDILIGKEQTVEMTEALATVTSGYNDWASVSVNFSVTEEDTYYFGLHFACGYTYRGIAIDEVRVEVVPDYLTETSLQLPYSLYPSVMSLPPFSASVKNTGVKSLTDIKLTASLNGNPIGESDGAEVLAPMASSDDVALVPTGDDARPLVGSNTLTVTGSAKEGGASTATRTFTGTTNVLALENGEGGPTVTLAGAGMMGNVFVITENVTLSQVLTRFHNITVKEYAISLYPTDGVGVDLDNPLFEKHPATKTAAANAVSFANVPKTVLTPGSYFLGIHQDSGQDAAVSYPSIAGRTGAYTLSEGTSTLVLPNTTYAGAFSIRMLFQTETCPALAPTNLKVTYSANANTATFSWTGNGALKYVLTYTDGVGYATKLETTATSITATGLTLESAYTWTVAAYCDAENLGTPVEGSHFSTKAFSETFETATVGTTLPTGWTSSALVSSASLLWQVGTSTTIIPMVGDARYIYLTASMAAYSSLMIAPKLGLKAGTSYRVGFYYYAAGSSAGAVTLKLGREQVADSLTRELGTITGAGSWKYVYLDFEVEEDGTYHIGFLNTGNNSSVSAIDNITIGLTPSHALKIEAAFPYASYPSNLTLPTLSAKATNIGTQATNGVMLSAALNGETLGSSAVQGTIAEGATTPPLTLTPNAHLDLGANQLAYTLQADETLGNAATSTAFSITGTLNTLAMENEGTTVSINFTNAACAGNLFEIAETTTLSQVWVNYAKATESTVSISLYELTSGLALDFENATPVLTQPVAGTVVGWNLIDVAQTELTPGTYFLCVNEPNTAGPRYYITNDKTGYTIGAAGTALTAASTTTGAFAIRMFVQLADCPKVPTDLDVTGSYFSWEGDALRYLLTITHATEAARSYDISTTFFTCEDLTIGEAYSWTVAAYCDAVNTGTPIAGADFTALNCLTGAIAGFPWSYGFEADENPFGCLRNEYVAGAVQWATETYGDGAQTAAVLPNDGTAKGTITKLILPKFDMSGLSHPAILTFSHLQGANGGNFDQLRVYYKTSAAGSWVELAAYTTAAQGWTAHELILPNPSADYYLAFEGTTNLGLGVYVDDITVREMVCTASISTFPWVYTFDDADGDFASCWSQEIGASSVAWTKATSGKLTSYNDAPAPTAAHSSPYMALFYQYSSGRTTKLVLPKMDLSAMTGVATLSFWYALEYYNASNSGYVDSLTVYYKTSVDGDWVKLAEFNKLQRSWAEITLELPEPSNDYYIAFEACSKYGGGIALDDITVYDENRHCPEVINTFPWTYDFEIPDTEGNFEYCWTQEQLSSNIAWKKVSANTAGSTYAPAAAHIGEYFALFANNAANVGATRLVLPLFDLSGVENPVLTFWHVQEYYVPAYADWCDTLKVYYKAAEADEWTLLATYDSTQRVWAEKEVVLPNPSSTYYIAFEGAANYGRGIALDDITVGEGKAVDDGDDDDDDNGDATAIAPSVGTVFSVYPNPVADALFIQTAANVKRADIFDARGKVVKTVFGDVREVVVTELKAGIYILQLTTDNGIFTQRFVKQ